MKKIVQLRLGAQCGLPRQGRIEKLYPNGNFSLNQLAEFMSASVGVATCNSRVVPFRLPSTGLTRFCHFEACRLSNLARGAYYRKDLPATADLMRLRDA